MTVEPDAPRTRVVLTGDSITETGRHEDASGLGTGYARLVAERLAASARARGGDVPHVVNTGVGGDRLVDLERRWDEDVLAHEPALVSVLVGINDTWRRHDGGEPSPADAFEARLDGLLRRTTAAGARLVLLEPFVVPVEPGQERWEDDLGPRRSALRAVADRHGAVLVPTAAAVAEAAGRRSAVAVAADGVHPTPLGHRVLADAWVASVERSGLLDALLGARSGSPR
ncbi:GDSL-type esterase/lipase family protein [uncultured Pseudokineococcus sp.]|uniref:GDSL-type esterase/lipase family protein n=1 Tax=uncultured Pseudokineococcus sp. TaxID=1642928 RepID=UPI002626C377|nr:GDSL-type esterase/lipase family protein [uncultured Pseudokineococcus sp.]